VRGANQAPTAGEPSGYDGAMRGRFVSQQLRDHVRGFFTNWREYDGPVATKIRLTVKNRARALRHGCCGHHGQPGC
jgi:hypothetical protein